MRLLLHLVVAVAVAAGFSFVYGGHHHHGTSGAHHHHGTIEETDAVMSCPPGFKRHGKQCIKFVTAEPLAHCPFGFERLDGHAHECIMFFEKVFECPRDTFQQDGTCIRTTAVDAIVECPEGFKLTSSGHQCFRHLAGPKRFLCPAETFMRDDVCILKRSANPELRCPKGFAFTEDKRCKLVETFDCSPSFEDVQPSHKHHKHLLLRRLGASKKHSATSKESAPVQKQRVIAKTCEKIRIESPVKICHKGALVGKQCFFDEEIAPIEKKREIIEEIVTARFICPEGHLPGAFRQCLLKERVPLKSFCPNGSERVEHKCAKFAPILLSCPPGFALDGQCVKKVSLSFCGEDCAHHHHAAHKK